MFNKDLFEKIKDINVTEIEARYNEIRKSLVEDISLDRFTTIVKAAKNSVNYEEWTSILSGIESNVGPIKMSMQDLADSLSSMEKSIRNVEGDDVADLSRVLSLTGLMMDRSKNLGLVLAVTMVESQFVATGSEQSARGRLQLGDGVAQEAMARLRDEHAFTRVLLRVEDLVGDAALGQHP